MRSIAGAILTIFLLVFIPLTGVAEGFEEGFSAHPLIPLTSEADLIPCHEYLNYDQEFNRALQCSASTAIPELNKISVEKPKCYVIKSSSPDVRNGSVFNSISTGLIFSEYIVGFYEDITGTMYIVDNVDAPMILRHELQHYFLDKVKGNADGAHVHEIWSTCEEGYYTPSEKAKEQGDKNIKMQYNIILRSIILFSALEEVQQYNGKEEKRSTFDAGDRP